MNFSDYYIAFFDALGCKSFFNGDEQAELEFVKNLKGMVDRSVASAFSINRSLVLSQLADMRMECKLFKKDIKAVAERAKVIQKYKWLVVYHNQLCTMHKKDDCILTINYSFDPETLNDYMK